MVSCLGTDAIGEDHDALANEFAKARVRSLTAHSQADIPLLLVCPLSLSCMSGA
jgi:hypothetical protein